MKITNYILTFAAAGFLLPAAFAQDAKPGTIEQRKDNQENRIGQGIQSGSLTPPKPLAWREGKRASTAKSAA